MSETSLRASSCIELSEIKKLDSLLRQCETLSYDDLSSSSNGDHELADYMEPKGRIKRRNSSSNQITTPPLTKTAIRALSNFNIFNSAKKIMRMVNENSAYYDRNCLLPQKSQDSYKTKSCSNLQKPLYHGNHKPSNEQACDHFFSISENILSTAATPLVREVDCSECECHCPLPPVPEPQTVAAHPDSSNANNSSIGANQNALSQKAIRKRRPTERQSNNHHHHHSSHQPPSSSKDSSHVTSPTAAPRRPNRLDNAFPKHRKFDVDDENRIVNINETPNIVPISLPSITDSPSFDAGGCSGDDVGGHRGGGGDRRASGIRHQKSLDNKSDKSQLSQANSTKSRSKFSPQYLSRKISHKTPGSGGQGEGDAGGEGGAKESLLGHKFEKILTEPVETVSTYRYLYPEKK